MPKNKRMGIRVLAPVVVITVFFSLVLYFFSESTVSGLVDTALDRRIASKLEEIAASEERIASEMLNQAALFSRVDAVLAAYRTAHQGEIDDAQDPYLAAAREQLQEHFANVRRGYVDSTGAEELRLHFHLPPARSLARLWKRDQSESDDLRAFRETILTISGGSHGPVKGIEAG